MKNLSLFAIVLLFLSCGKKEESNNSVEKVTEPASVEVENDLPRLPLVMQDGTETAANKLKGPLALVLFQPDCDHCQREAQQIQQNIGGFRNFTLYFVSSASMDEVVAFARAYQLDQSPQVKLATTTVPEILKSFGPIDAPSIYLYDSEGKLIQSFNGEVAIEVVLKYI